MFNERELDEIQDQLKEIAIAKAEREELRIQNETRILLRRCTMCQRLSRRFIDCKEDSREASAILKEEWREPEICECMEYSGDRRKMGFLVPVGILYKW